MSATIAKYKTLDYLEQSVSSLTKKERSSIQYLGNAWQKHTINVKRPATTYFSELSIADFQIKKTAKNQMKNKSINIYIPFEDEIILFGLKPLYKEINLSKDILELEEGWDGFDAPKIPNEIYEKSISFLKEYSIFIYNNTGVVIDTPEINPGRNKNIFLSWRTQKARMAISIESKDGELIANYYGDINNKQPIKGYVSTDKISEYLAYWMINLA